MLCLLDIVFDDLDSLVTRLELLPLDLVHNLQEPLDSYHCIIEYYLCNIFMFTN